VLAGSATPEARCALESQAGVVSALEIIAEGEAVPEAAELIVLLDGAAIPTPGFLAAHLRWHAAASDVVVLGPVSRPPEGSSAPAAVSTEPSERWDEADSAFDVVFDLTRGLTETAGAIHMAAALGSISVRADVLAAAGGLGEPGPLQRLDVAARLASYGCVFVPEAAAVAWSHETERARELAGAIAANVTAHEPLEASRPEEARIVAMPPFRRTASARHYTRPAMVVNLDAGEEPAENVLATLEAILRGRLGDLELRVQIADEHPARERIAERLALDPRTAIGPPSMDAYCESPFQASVPAAALPDERTIADLHRLMIEEEVGALHVTVPGAPPQDVMIEVVASGALARSRRVAAAQGGDPVEVLGRLFDERWVSGVEVSVRAHGVAEPHVTEHGPLAAATDPEHERNQHLRFRDRADELEQRAVVLSRRALAERLESRRVRLRADQLEARLESAGSPPRFWRLHPFRRAAAAARRKRK